MQKLAASNFLKPKPIAASLITLFLTLVLFYGDKSA